MFDSSEVQVLYNETCRIFRFLEKCGLLPHRFHFLRTRNLVESFAAIKPRVKMI